MATSRDLPDNRLAVGQLLGRLLRQFRVELFAAADEGGFGDLREPHLQIFGNVGVEGIRLTDLAARAQLSMAATSDLVSDLQALGYLERRPDASDRRAKLIYPTVRGRRALDLAGDRVAEIEQRWSSLVGTKEFARACKTLQQLLEFTAPDEAKRKEADLRRGAPITSTCVAALSESDPHDHPPEGSGGCLC